MPVEIRTYRLTARHKAAIVLLTLVGLGAGALLLVFGLALVAALATAGLVVGTGAALWRRLRGGRATLPDSRPARAGLDPANEVFLPPGERERNEE